MSQETERPTGAGATTRPAIGEHTAAARRVLLLSPYPESLPAGVRIDAAARAAELAGRPALAAAYRDLAPAQAPAPTGKDAGRDAGEGRDPESLTAAVRAFTDRVTLAPGRAGADALTALTAQGLDAPAVVALAQICAFVSYEARVDAGLALLTGGTAAEAPGAPGAPAVPGAPEGPEALDAAAGADEATPEAPFTLDQLTWRPRIPAVDADALTPEQRAVIDAHATLSTGSPYYRTLLHHPAALDHRTHVYNAIMYGRGGLPRAERELATLVVSRVNGCVYCASVHGRKYAQLARDEARALRVLREGAAAFAGPDGTYGMDGTDAPGRTYGTDAPYRTDTPIADPRAAAVARFAEAQTRTPPQAGAGHLAALRAAGLGDAELVDLVHAVALFGWANRLMLVLGDAHHPGPPPQHTGVPGTAARESCSGTSVPAPRTGGA
ncbi:peroxidase-related enzyme [Streptomyces sp. NPDC093085]|uniref:peroxidase-related enzyme n=1 Tax=Streptomyces sp. NPDC093085 TaxID=3155068 RepID=UPI00342E3828